MPSVLPSSAARTRRARSRATGTRNPAPFKLVYVLGIHQPLPMHAQEGPAEGSLYGGEREVDVEPPARGMDVGEAFGRLECPYLLEANEDQRPLPAGDDARRRARSVRLQPRTAVAQPLEALRHARLGERLEQVVDDAEIERLERMLARGGGEDEQGRGGPLRVGPHKLEALVVHLAAYQLHVDEGDVDGDIGGRRIEDLPRIVRGCYRADDLRGAGRLQELDEMVARRPLVFDDQRAQRH